MAGKRNITIRKGDDYSHVVTITNTAGPIDITGRTYTSQFRKIATQASPDGTFTVAVTDGPAGELTITMPNATTTNLDVGCYKWDLQENSGGIITTILAGEVNVITDVTR